MKKFTNFFLFNPLWLFYQTTFCWLFPLIGALAGGAASIVGGDKQAKADAKTVAEQDKLNREAAEQNFRYANNAARIDNERRLANYERSAGFSGGIEGDMSKSRNLFHRKRLGSVGYLPQLSYEDEQVREALGEVRDGGTAADLYRQLDVNDHNDWVTRLKLDYDPLAPENNGGIEGTEEDLAEWRRIRALGDTRTYDQWLDNHYNPTPESMQAGEGWDYTEEGWVKPRKSKLSLFNKIAPFTMGFNPLKEDKSGKIKLNFKPNANFKGVGINTSINSSGKQNDGSSAP